MNDVKSVSGVTQAASAALPSSGRPDSNTSATPSSSTALPQTDSATKALTANAPKVVPVESGGVLQFSVDSTTSQLIVKVVDGDTSEVIRKIPTESVEEVVAQVRGTPGLMINQTS